MRNALRTWSNVLQLRDDTFQWFKFAPAAVPFAIGMFMVVALIAGFGRWLALPAVLQQPTLAEQIGRVDAVVGRLSNETIPPIYSALDSLSRENLSFALNEIFPAGATITAAGLARVIEVTGLDGEQVAALLAQGATVPPAVRERLQTEGVTTDSLTFALEETGVTPEEFGALLAERAQAQAAEAGVTLEGLAAGLAAGGAGVQEALIAIALTPDVIGNTVIQLGLSPEQVQGLKEQIAAVPEAGQGILSSMRGNVEALEPPLGVGFSRFLNLAGQWLSTPFALLAAYLPVALVALLMAKLLGGKATLKQHLVMMSLAIAPAVLLLLTYWVGNPPTGLTLITATVVRFLSRFLVLVTIVWSLAILLKALAHAHEFSMWRAAGTLALTYVVLYVLLPLTGFFAAAFFLRS